MESPLAILMKDVECSLCQDTLIEPKLLKCFHTFCKLCIKRHAELIEGVNVFKCPKCLSETCLPQLSSVEDLQPSLLHSRMVNILAFVESEKVCSISATHSSASWHCFDCDRSFCDECEKNHSVFNKDHKVVCVVETKEEDLKLMLRRESNCVHHVNETVELFCEGCKQGICIECFKHGHERHSTISITKHTSANKAFMSEQLEQLKQQKETMQKRFKIIEKANIELKETCDYAKNRLQAQLQEVIEILQKNALELISQIDETLEKAEKRKVKVHSTLDQTQGAIDYMNKLIENGLANELIENKIKKENCTTLDDTIQHERIVFDSNEELMKQVNVGLGTLRTVELTDPTMSSVEVEGELEAVKKAKLVVLTTSQTGKLTDDPSDVIDVKISPEDDVKIEEKYVRKEGKIEVEFMAKVPGQLTAEVKVNGNHLSNSPLVMNVKPQKMRKTRQFNMKSGYKRSHNFKGIAVNKENSRIAVADESAHCVHVFNTDGNLLLTYGSKGSGQGQLSGPEGLAFLNETDLVISDYDNYRICIVNTTTRLVKTFGNQGNGDGEFRHPYGVHVDDDGNIIVSDRGNHRVQVFTKDGDYQYKFGLTKQNSFDPLSTVTHRGLFYVSDYNNNVIHVFEKKGNVPTRISTIGGQGSADGQLSRPRGLAIDNDHNLLVCDFGNNRIQKFTLDGCFVGKTCDEIKNPFYVAVLNDGQLLVTCGSYGVFYVE